MTQITNQQALHALVNKHVVHDPNITRLLRMIDSTSGTDKIYRTIQFTVRFLAYFVPSSSFTAIRKQFGLSRKLMRMGNNLESLRALFETLKHDDWVWTDVVQHAGYAAFGFVDGATYFPNAGIFTFSLVKLCDQLAFIFWGAALVATIIGGINRIQTLRRQIILQHEKERLPTFAEWKLHTARTDQRRFEFPPTPPDSPVDVPSSPLKSTTPVSTLELLRTEQKDVFLNTIAAAADAIFPPAGLGWIEINDGVLGFAGSVSSFVGLRKAWMKTK